MTKIYSFLIVAVVFASNVMAQNIPSYVPKNGLVGWWPFNGNANDESGNGNNGTVNGATLTTDRNGTANRAYSFDGVSNFIKVANSLSLDIIGSEITISYWLLSNNEVSDANYKGISKGGYQVGSGYEFMFRNSYSGDNGVIHLTGGPGMQGSHINFDMNVASGKWIHLGVTYKNGTVMFFVDGKLQTGISTNLKSNFVSNKDDLFIGKRNPSNDWAGLLKGKLDDIAIYNRALTEQEISSLYLGCSHEAATINTTNSFFLNSDKSVDLVATPSGGTFSGSAVKQGKFEPSSAKIGLNKVVYNYKNSTGCDDVTEFKLVVADTNGTICKYTDTLKVTKYDTVSVLKINFKLTTGIKANQLTSLSVYPNPTSDVLKIEVTDVKAFEAYRYRILDAVGKEVYNELVKNPITEIPMKSLGATGIYLFEVLDANKLSVQSNQIILQ